MTPPENPGLDDLRHLTGLLGHLVLVLALPLAFLGATAFANEYRAMGEGDFLDCDGPSHVFMFAVPAFFIYGMGFVVNGFKFRVHRHLVVAIICAAIAVALAVNLADAIVEQARIPADCG